MTAKPELKKEKLQGGILIIGSLYWENETNAVNKVLGKLREDWRIKELNIEEKIPVRCLIRYGRKSSSRYDTYTMLFSNSCPKLGSAILVPFKDTIPVEKDFKGLADQVSTVALVEGIREATEINSFKKWGMVALKIMPSLINSDPDVAKQLKDWWAGLHRGSIDENPYRISGLERSSVTNEGFLNIEVFSEDDLKPFDYILATPVVPGISAYPTGKVIADAMNKSTPKYHTYFLENIKAEIRTFQDEEIIENISDNVSDLITYPSELLDFNNYPASQDGVNQFRKDLVRRLGDSLFIPSETALCFHVLKSLVYPFEHKPGEDIEAIEKGCNNAVELFDKRFGIYHDPFVKPEKETPCKKLLFYVLGMEKVPGMVRERIEALIKTDLKDRQKLIEYYEQFRAIKAFKEENKIPGTHEDRIYYDFYIRNVTEQRKILKYFIDGLNNRVINKCWVQYLKPTFDFEWYFDRPYITAIPNSSDYFDNRQMDLCGHRIGEVPIVKARELQKVYKNDQEEFYKELQKYLTVDQVFHQLKYYLGFLSGPIIDRKPVFEELELLFKEKRWFGFYSLGLAQIEGLFTEMLKTIDQDLLKPSLTEKVEAVRPVYELAHHSFDYYQYHIPILRNKFMHLGIDKIGETNCYDILYDLLYLFKVYTELKTPLPEINNIIKKKQQEDFLDIHGFNRYFDLIEAVKRSGNMESIKNEVELFEKDFLIGYIDIEHFVREVQDLVPKAIAHWYNTIKVYTEHNTVSVDLEKLTMHLFEKSKDEYLVLINPVYEAYKEIFSNLNGYNRFLARFEKYLPSLSKNLKDDLNKLYEKHKDDFKKLSFILNNIIE